MKYVNLEQIADILNGYNFKSSNYVNEGIRVIRITNVQQGYLEDKDPVFYEYFDELNKYMLKENDLLMSLTGNVGRVGILTPILLPAGLNQRVACIRCKNANFSTKFLYYFFNNDLFRKNAILNSNGVAQLNLSTEWLKKVKIPFYDVSIQHEITEKLDKITYLIDKNKKQLFKLDNIVKSQFIEMFGDCDKTELSNITEIIMGQSPDSKFYNDLGEGVPFFQGKADYGEKYTIVKHWTTNPTKIAKADSVLMSVRAPVGPVNIANVDCCIGRGLCSIDSLKGKTNNEFLYNALKVMESDIALMGSGSTFKAINKNDIFNLMIPNAPLVLQNKFSLFAQQIDKSKYFGGVSYGIC